MQSDIFIAHGFSCFRVEGDTLLLWQWGAWCLVEEMGPLE